MSADHSLLSIFKRGYTGGIHSKETHMQNIKLESVGSRPHFIRTASGSKISFFPWCGSSSLGRDGLVGFLWENTKACTRPEAGLRKPPCIIDLATSQQRLDSRIGYPRHSITVSLS